MVPAGACFVPGRRAVRALFSAVGGDGERIAPWRGDRLRRQAGSAASRECLGDGEQLWAGTTTRGRENERDCSGTRDTRTAGCDRLPGGH